MNGERHALRLPAAETLATTPRERLGRSGAKGVRDALPSGVCNPGCVLPAAAVLAENPRPSGGVIAAATAAS